MEGASSPPRPGRSASRREKSGPVRPVQQQFREKTRPARTGTPHMRYKIRPARSKCRFFAYFARAGRILSRFSRQQAEQGEFCLAHTHFSPSRANFFSQTYRNSGAWRIFSDTRHDNFAGLKPSSHLRQRSRWPHETATTAATAAQLADETDGTTARLPDLSNETTIANASPEHPKNQRFPRAKVTAVSPTHEDQAAKVSPVSSRQSSARDTAPMHRVAQHCSGI